MKDKKAFFQNQIMKWGEKNYRDFIWRRHKDDLYIVFMAEFLLRRTRATDVNEFLIHFLKKYKSFKEIHSTSLRTLKKQLKPLGLYNNRARALKKISSYLTNRKGITYEEILSFPHCGRYMANAIMCFHHGEKCAIVDNNVRRILNRFFSLSKAINKQKLDNLWEQAFTLLPSNKFMEYNYYLLDFSAIICKPIHPECVICPLQSKCNFYHNKLNSNTI